MTKAKNRSLLSFAILLPLLGTAVAEGGELKGRIVVADREVGPAVVWIQGVADGSVPRHDTVISHVSGGRFEPSVSIGFVGNDFVFRSEDNTLHTTHLYLHLAYQKAVSGRPLVNGATLYNIALPKAGMEVRRPIRPYHEYRDETGIIVVKCNPHPEEKAFVLVFNHPYAAVSTEDGRFSIPDVPAGKHEVWVWRVGAGNKWRTVDFKDKEPTEVVIELGSGP